MRLYNLEHLRSAYRAGEKLKYLFFWGHTPSADGIVDQSCFSQWWMSRFQVDGTEYSCAEQYMMAEKAGLFADKEALGKIMEARHPGEMKALGRAVRGFDNAVWNSHCYEIVKRGNAAKFAQNEDLRKYLSSTGDRVLVEASPVDRIWGIGLAQSHPDAANPERWQGDNRLGFALMETRDTLEGGKKNEQKRDRRRNGGNC